MTIIAIGVFKLAKYSIGVPITFGRLSTNKNSGRPSITPTVPGFKIALILPALFPFGNKRTPYIHDKTFSVIIYGDTKNTPYSPAKADTSGIAINPPFEKMIQLR